MQPAFLPAMNIQRRFQELKLGSWGHRSVYHPVDKVLFIDQPGRSLKKNLKELPKVCDVGTKKNSKGYKESWIGFKLHLDVVDGDIPVSGILSSVHCTIRRQRFRFRR
jgi:hypothetical protein